MKKLSCAIASLLFAISANLVMADEAASSEKPQYIPWTWDDISD